MLCVYNLVSRKIAVDFFDISVSTDNSNRKQIFSLLRKM